MKRVKIIAPSNKAISVLESNKKLEKICSFLDTHGFETSLQANMFSDDFPFYANSKEARLDGLRNAMLDPSIDIIWAFRGGSGAGEIADLCMDIRPVGNKILIGFSDITFLHMLFNQYYGISSIHGPVLTSLTEKHPDTINDIISILGGEAQKIEMSPMNNAAKEEIQGEITGGNLTLICTMIGTKLHPNTKGKIIILEDIAEQGYKIARNLNHMEKAGLFREAAACVFGDFVDCDQNVDFAINQFIKNQPNLPIFMTKGIGHGDVNNPIVFGTKGMIRNGSMEFFYRSYARQ
ncbi:MAG UNVERIFIED_CONTAM: LD-carboxypeptidase [Rickettsiaceae bacterium]|jgi:muramoyltetrapeptide carboxypeptidase LdcA involved in peptidoglycan recycling